MLGHIQHQQDTKSHLKNKERAEETDSEKSADGKNKDQAINMYALPFIRYPAGIISWAEEEIEATDVKARKLLTIHGGF